MQKQAQDKQLKLVNQVQGRQAKKPHIRTESVSSQQYYGDDEGDTDLLVDEVQTLDSPLFKVSLTEATTSTEVKKKPIIKLNRKTKKSVQKPHRKVRKQISYSPSASASESPVQIKELSLQPQISTSK